MNNEDHVTKTQEIKMNNATIGPAFSNSSTNAPVPTIPVADVKIHVRNYLERSSLYTLLDTASGKLQAFSKTIRGAQITDPHDAGDPDPNSPYANEYVADTISPNREIAEKLAEGAKNLAIVSQDLKEITSYEGKSYSPDFMKTIDEILPVLSESNIIPYLDQSGAYLGEGRYANENDKYPKDLEQTFLWVATALEKLAPYTGSEPQAPLPSLRAPAPTTGLFFN